MLAACGRVSFFVLTPPKCWISLLTELNLRETRRGSASPAAFGLHILSRRSFLGAAARGTLFPSRIGLTSLPGLDFPRVPVSSQAGALLRQCCSPAVLVSCG